MHTIKCSCGAGLQISKPKNFPEIYNSQWSAYGFSINRNDYIYLCPKCTDNPRRITDYKETLTKAPKLYTDNKPTKFDTSDIVKIDK